MSSQTIHPFRIPQAPARLGTLRAVVQHHLARLARGFWQALEAHGQRRGDLELAALAERWRHTNPKAAREIRSYLRGGSTY